MLAPTLAPTTRAPATHLATTTHLAATTHLAPTVTLKPRSKPRGFAYDRMATINVVWGLNDPAVSSSKELLVNKQFDMRGPREQEALVSFCDRAAKAHLLKVFRIDCWPRDFARFQKDRGLPFPSANLVADVHSFLATRSHLVGQHMGKDEFGAILSWTSASFRVEFDTHSSGRQIAPYMAAWQDFLIGEHFQAKQSGAVHLGSAFTSTDMFVRAEAELLVINSALSSWLVSVGCALLFVVAFTQNFALSAIATFAIFATAACSLYTITSIFCWHFGLMEAVSLIVFCGFSVDYPLHMVQSYVQERDTGKGIAAALQEVGCAVTSGCFTTVGAAAFLLLCDIKIFTRFGQVLMANMGFSLIFAVLWIPAALESYEACCSRRKPQPHDDCNGTRSRSSGGGRASVPRLDLSSLVRQDDYDEVPEGFQAFESDVE